MIDCLGTKVTCQQGGCGSCVVALTKQDPVTGKHKTIAVNSVRLSCVSYVIFIILKIFRLK